MMSEDQQKQQHQHQQQFFGWVEACAAAGKSAAGRILSQHGELGFTAAYGAVMMYQQAQARRELLPARKRMLTESASAMVHSYIEQLARKPKADAGAGSDGTSQTQQRSSQQAPDSNAGGQESTTFALPKRRPSAHSNYRDLDSVPGCPTYAVLYLDAVPAGATMAGVDAAVVERADAHLAAARTLLTAARAGGTEGAASAGSASAVDAALLLRSSEFVFAGLDHDLVPVSGAGGGRVIGPVDALTALNEWDPVGRQLFGQHQPTGHHGGQFGHEPPFDPVAANSVATALVRDFACVARAVFEVQSLQAMHRLNWVADRLRAVELRQGGSTNVRVSTGVAFFDDTAPDGFPRGAQRLDVATGRLVACPTREERDAGLSEAQRTAIARCDETATRPELVSVFRVGCSKLAWQCGGQWAKITQFRRDSAHLVHVDMPRRLFDATSAVVAIERSPAFRAPTGALRACIRLLRDVGAVQPMAVFLVASQAGALVHASRYLLDARSASETWGARVNIQSGGDADELSATTVAGVFGEIARHVSGASVSAATRALLVDVAELLCARSTKTVCERIDVGLNARVVLSVATADLAGLDGDSLAAIRQARSGGGMLTQTIRDALEGAYGALQTWSEVLSISADLVQQPIGTAGVGLVSYGLIRSFGYADGAVPLPWCNHTFRQDRRQLDPAQSAIYATTSEAVADHGGPATAAMCGSHHPLQQLPRTGRSAALLLNAAMVGRRAVRGVARDGLALDSMLPAPHIVRDDAKLVASERMRWTVAQPGLSLLLATAATPPETRPALSALGEVTRWPSSPPPLASATLPALSALAAWTQSDTLRRVEADVTEDMAAVRLASLSRSAAESAATVAALNEKGKLEREREARRSQLAGVGVTGGATVTSMLNSTFADDAKWLLLRVSGSDTRVIRCGLDNIEASAASVSHPGVANLALFDRVSEASVRSALKTVKLNAMRWIGTADAAVADRLNIIRRRAPAEPETEAQLNRRVQRALAVEKRLDEFILTANYEQRYSIWSPLASTTTPILNAVGTIEHKLNLPHAIDRISFRSSDGANNAEAHRAPDVSLAGAAITFEHVSFAYPGAPERLVLDDVSFHVPAGAFAAIVGESGCGKSTLVALLLRVFDCTSGRILVDGVDVRTVAPRGLRRRLGFVGQACGLLPLRVDENLRVGAPESTLAGQWAALERACVRDVVEQRPGQLLAAVTPGTLSGGERQRLVLARALARLSPSGGEAGGGLHAFILDEATSALDVVTERQVQRALGRVGVTTVAIAHRLATVREASVVIVLGGGGRVVETGSFAELAGRGPSSALGKLVRLQQSAGGGGGRAAVAAASEAAVQLRAAVEGRVGSDGQPHQGGRRAREAAARLARAVTAC